MVSNSEVLNLFQTKSQIHTHLSTRMSEGYKGVQFIETSWQFINNITNSPLKTGSYISYI
jgi:hypothetical protein